jgi:Transmembrane amino acid transporter protein
MYPSTTLFIAAGQLAIVTLVMLSYPLQVHPCRNCLDKIFHIRDTTIKPLVQGEEHEDDDDNIVDDHVSATMPPVKHAVLTTAIILSGFIIAYMVDDLQIGAYNYVLAKRH